MCVCLCVCVRKCELVVSNVKDMGNINKTKLCD